jgi:acyl dehydratase
MSPSELTTVEDGRERIRDLDALRARVGSVLGVSEWRTIDQDLIDRFAAVSGDHNWVHVDPERARRDTDFGGTIAHGHLTLLLVSRFVDEMIEVGQMSRVALNYGFNRVRFVAPVPSGSRVRGRVAVRAVDPIPGGTQLTMVVIIECDRSDRPVCIAEPVFRLYE